MSVRKRGLTELGTAGAATLALFALAFGRGWTPATADHRGALRLAYFPNVTHAPALVGVARGVFQRHLPQYRLSSKVVDAGPEAMEALLAGEIDFAYVGPSPAVNTFLKTQGKALTVIANACDGGASLVARADVNISSVRDLDGHSVGVPQLGGTQDVSCRRFLDLNGLTTTDHHGTVTIVPAKNADILTLFRRKQLDAAWVPEPWASRLRSETGAKTVVDERSLWPNHRFTTTVLVVRNDFAKAHPEAVAAIERANEETIAWMHDHVSEAKEATNQELRRITGKPIPAKVLDEAWSHVDFSAKVNPANIAAFAQAAYREGYLKTDPGALAGLIKGDTQG